MQGKSKKVKWKIGLLILLAGFFCAALVSAQRDYAREKQRAEEIRREEEERREEKERAEAEKKAREQKEQERAAQEEKETEAASKVTISNLSEMAEPVLGTYAYLLEDELSEWVKEQGLPIHEAETLEADVPENDAQTTVFYVQLEDQDSPVAMLAWHVRERVVTVSSSGFTASEIKAGALSGDAPEERDVPEGKDNPGDASEIRGGESDGGTGRAEEEN